MLLTAIWDDCRVAIRLEDATFNERLEQFLAIELIPFAGTDGEPPTIEVRRGKQGWEFVTPFGRYVAEHEDDAAFVLLESLANEFILRTRRPIVHAGAFVNDGGAVLYLGGLRQGKSRLTFAAWCRGYPVLGDDRIALLIDERSVQPLPRCVKLRLGDGPVPSAWRAHVPEDAAFVGKIGDDRRWVLSRRLPGMVDCEAAVPVRAVVTLRRVDAGPTRLDEISVSAALEEVIPQTAFADSTPIDLLRFLKTHARRGRIPRLNVAPDEIDQGLDLLAHL